MLDYRHDCLNLYMCSSVIMQLIATITIVTVTNWPHTSGGDAAKPQVRSIITSLRLSPNLVPWGQYHGRNSMGHSPRSYLHGCHTAPLVPWYVYHGGDITDQGSWLCCTYIDCASS